MGGGIKNWPEEERPREKFVQRGPEALTDAELLALIIRTGDSVGKRSAIDLGRALLQEFGDLRTLALTGVTEICRIPGMGTAKAVSVKAALELGNRFGSKRLESFERFTAPSQVFEHFHHEFRDRRKEYFLALLLDGKNRIIKRVQISEGSLNQSIVHPREVFNPAVRESAAAIILVHNHPSGDPTPSREDLDITRRLAEAGELMGVKVLDHIIIGDGTFMSFTAQGML
ncbi:DNA repair protein RadC [Geobacter sp. DSM 9736]|uniref:RadC family protein n=1 Tax=Geobacter sp. DSM 9736 TaxID=1277350 RepID=UPI000B512C1E|nr:DNA repair protein RadC [Geobacter sp. DSM 9736]SNB47086.1 DNA replication and repair protein RadC [Geobacter sp. DSM 9736]